jgi:two-component system, sensor histidine kinase LadS
VILRRLFFLIVLSLAGWCAQAQSDLIATRGIYVDKTINLPMDEVVDKEFSPFGGLLKRSLSPSVRWIHLTIDRSRSTDQVATLVVGPHYLAEIALYEKQQGQWVRRVVGDRYPSPQPSCPFGSYCFVIALDKLDSPDLYLRVQTINGYYITTQLLDRVAVEDEMRDRALSAGLECGVLLVLIVLSFLLVLTGGGTIASYFCLTQITALGLTLSVLGVLANYLTPEYAWVDNFLFNLFYVLRCLFSVLLSIAFLKNLPIPVWYTQVTRALVAIFVFEIVWLLLMPVSLYSLAFNFAFIVLWPLIWLIVLFQVRIQPLTHRYLMLGITMSMGLMMWVDMIPAFGLTQFDRMLVPGNFGGLMVSVLMSLLVTSEVRVRSQMQKKLIADLARAQSINMLESQQIKERSMMIDMLTHELKNPLAAMRMAAGSLKTSLMKLPASATQDSNDRISSMIDAIQGMNTVIERCVQVDSLDQGKMVVIMEEIDIEELLSDARRASRDPGRIRIHIHSPPLLFKTDAGLLSIVLTNLVDNALKYSPHDSLVEVSVRMDVRAFKLVVENAVGVAGSPEPEKVFFRYYRGEHAHAWPGTGLGLYLVKSICDILNGSVECQATVEKVNFSVTLQS